MCDRRRIGRKIRRLRAPKCSRSCADERTQVDNRFAIIPYRTRFYEKTESGTVRNADFLDSSYKIPGGGWLSSAEDMARFEVAILNDKLIRRTTRDLMWTPLKPSDGLTHEYGLGWRWGDENDHEVRASVTSAASKAPALPFGSCPRVASAWLC